jgi:hypothetical protein
MDANFCFVESEMRIGLPGLPSLHGVRVSIPRTCFAFRVDLSQHVFLTGDKAPTHIEFHMHSNTAIYGCFPADQATCGVDRVVSAS